MAASNGHDPDGLTLKQAKFATLISQGYTGADAYRASYQVGEDTKPETVWANASRERARTNVAARIRELLSKSRLNDLDSIGEAIHRTKELIGQAVDARNYSAAMKGNADLLKMHGLLRDTLVIKWEQELSDDQLVTRLAGNDPELLEAAQKLLRAPDSFADLANDPSIIEVEPEKSQ